jgi:hypothetical protein
MCMSVRVYGMMLSPLSESIQGDLCQMCPQCVDLLSDFWHVPSVWVYRVIHGMSQVCGYTG